MGYLEANFRAKIGSFELDAYFSMDREISVVFGPSGSGKSFFLRCLSGLNAIDEGYIDLDGQRLNDSARRLWIPASRRGVCLMPQNLSLFPHMTVLENVAFGCKGDNSHSAHKEALYWLKRMRIDDFQDRYPNQLSGGQRQRVALARALAVRPKVLLLDEPFSALDGPLKRNLRRELRKLQRETGVPFIYVTHHVEDICALGDRVHFIHDGKMSESLNVEELISGGGRLRFWKMMGWGNIMEGEVVFNETGKRVFRWTGGEVVVKSTGGTGEAIAFIRPEMIRFIDPRYPVDEEISPNLFEGKIEDVILEGGIFRIHVSSDSGVWQVEQKDPVFCSRKLRPGERVYFSFHPDSVELVIRDSQRKGEMEYGSGAFAFDK
ncbi:ABC transporter ATP-binding protein [Thermovirga lienii]|uniref:ABC transporter ATP-binding protein n=1 Tax=Thermovirga lienii TaxID=336261 RepID=UPI000EDFD6E7|nr:hypothetical protein [Thermovirga lienii]